MAGTEHYWLGSLAVGMRDASGQMYKRNRYYDPAKGQFTQPDPIGLAGGMNVYGFAEGDPVTYDDPYGLCGIAGAVTSVAEGAGIAMLTGRRYSLGRAVRDAGSGAICLTWARRAIRVARAADALLSAAAEDDPAAKTLPDLTGKTQAEADVALGEAGFEKEANAGSYQRYGHEDGSQISIGPDGRVVRQGTPIRSGANARSYRRRYGPDGKQIQHDPSGSNTHNTGEVISGSQP